MFCFSRGLFIVGYADSSCSHLLVRMMSACVSVYVQACAIYVCLCAHMRVCSIPEYLPKSLHTLSLAENEVSDLNQVCICCYFFNNIYTQVFIRTRCKHECVLYVWCVCVVRVFCVCVSSVCCVHVLCVCCACVVCIMLSMCGDCVFFVCLFVL